MTQQKCQGQGHWLGLIIGNSRLHWALFQGNQCLHAWDSDHLQTPVTPAGLISQLSTALPRRSPPLLPEIERQSGLSLPVIAASVVPEQTHYWVTYPAFQPMTLAQIPLTGLYDTLGIDRALALWAAGHLYGFPSLVIDAGTALTFTGANSTGHLVGGAILPGLSTQFQALGWQTATLPTVSMPKTLPSRWAHDTAGAIASGISYCFCAGISDFLNIWWQQFPQSIVGLTGGDALTVFAYLQQYAPSLAQGLILEPHLGLKGIQGLREPHD